MSGLALLRDRNGEFAAMNGSPVQPEALVTAMVRGLDGRLLSSSIDGDTISERGGRFETRVSPAGMPRSVVISIAETSSGDVWLGTRDAGLVGIRGGHLSHIVKGLPDRKINSILRADDRELWVGTDKGVVRWNGTEITTTGVPAALAGVQALSMVRDRGSNIWIGTASGGLVRVNGRGASVLGARSERPRGPVTALFEDRDGNLWVGSARGIERVRDSAFTTYSTSQGLPSDSQGPVHVDSDGRAWFAPSAGGLYWLKDGRVGRITAAGLGERCRLLDCRRETRRVDWQAARRPDAPSRVRWRVGGDDIHTGPGIGAEQRLCCARESRRHRVGGHLERRRQQARGRPLHGLQNGRRSGVQHCGLDRGSCRWDDVVWHAEWS